MNVCVLILLPYHIYNPPLDITHIVMPDAIVLTEIIQDIEHRI